MSISRGVLVHEWIEPRGGAENVLDALAEAFPDAPIHCLWNDAPERYTQDRVHESWIARTPLRHSKKLALPAMLEAWRRLGYSDAEWVLCSSHLFAHHAKFSGEARSARKFVYAHTPARYIWEPELDSRGQTLAARTLGSLIKPVDRRRASEAHSIAANSKFVKERIARCWNRESRVIYPPVAVEDYSRDRRHELSESELSILRTLPSEFVLGASRFVPYKQLERTIEVAEATGVAAVLAGDGPHRNDLVARADASSARVEILHRPSQPLLSELYKRAIAFIFASIEDFGIMPVESMAAGTPVIARRTGGVAESVLDGRTGVLLDSFSPAAMRDAVDASSRMSADDCLDRAQEFNTARFESEIRSWIDDDGTTATESSSRPSDLGAQL